MVVINEWLPNPAGDDAKGEFVELFNNGDAPVNINGWALTTTGKKVFFFPSHIIAPRGYLVLKRADTKLSLKNMGESVAIYDAAKHLVDKSSFLGQAESGKSFSRVYYPKEASEGAGVAGGISLQTAPQSFAWGRPTPGVANKVDLHNAISANNYPFSVPLGHAAPNGLEILEMIIGVGAILAVLVVYCVKSDETISQLFFPGDDGVRARAGGEDSGG